MSDCGSETKTPDYYLILCFVAEINVFKSAISTYPFHLCKATTLICLLSINQETRPSCHGIFVRRLGLGGSTISGAGSESAPVPPDLKKP